MLAADPSPQPETENNEEANVQQTRWLVDICGMFFKSIQLNIYSMLHSHLRNQQRLLPSVSNLNLGSTPKSWLPCLTNV